MKNRNRNSIIALLSIFFLAATVSAHSFADTAGGNCSGTKQTGPRATFERIWVDYDVTEKGKRGMLIHVQFKAYGMKNLDSLLAVFFQKRSGSNVTALLDTNRSFDSKDGYVVAFRPLKPGYDPAVYDDLTVFMPYEELHLGAGKHLLRMDVDLLYENEEMIQHLTNHDFEYTGASTTQPIGKPSAKFERIWVDYDITENRQRGMRIHAKFTVFNMIDIPSYVGIYFRKTDGTKLLTNNVNYRSKEGQVAVYRELEIKYDPGVYNDLTFFMPYSEFALTSGTYDLTMDVELIHKDGRLIQKLTSYRFEYIKP